MVGRQFIRKNLGGKAALELEGIKKTLSGVLDHLA
jgi:hypothetical protein